MHLLRRPFIKPFAEEFVYGGHLLSIGASGIVLTVFSLLDQPFNLLLLLIPYLSTQVVYTHNHFREISFDETSNPERARYVKKNLYLTKKLLFAYVMSLLLALLLTNFFTAIFVLFVLTGGILYTSYFKDFTTRYIAGFKNFYTATFWSLSIFLPLFFYRLELTPFFIYLFLFALLRFILSTAFFDIKDIFADGHRGLKTFPVIFGKKNTLIILQVLNIISIMPIIAGVYTEALPREALSLCVTLIYGFAYLTYSFFLDGARLRNLSYIVVDGEYLFWLILIFIGKGVL